MKLKYSKISIKINWGWLIAIVYLLLSLVIVSHYGITWDEPENFAIGHKYLFFYYGNKLDFVSDSPIIFHHPNFNNFHSSFEPQSYWPFANILSAISCNVFFQKLHLLPPIEAHHYVIQLLTAVLLVVLYWFFRRKTLDCIFPLSLILLLLTQPRFFGETFNNIKDMPEAIFFSLSIICFAHYKSTNKIGSLLLFFFAFACAITTKSEALLIPIILIIWQARNIINLIIRNRSIKILTVFAWLFGLVGIGFFIWSMYPPLWPNAYSSYSAFFHNSKDFIKKVYEYHVNIGFDSQTGWNLYAPYYLLRTIPLPLLIIFPFGFFRLLKNKEKENLNWLFIIWFFMILIRQSVPGVRHYDAIRQFIVILIPFTIITTYGIIELSHILHRLAHRKKQNYFIFISLLLIAINIYNLLLTHPYETTYYNFLAGGLKGAQKSDDMYDSDYWLNSYKAAGDYLDKNAKEKSSYYAFPYSNLITFSIKRSDLKVLEEKYLFTAVLKNTYVVLVPREWDKLSSIQRLVKSGKLVYSIKRQNGIIMQIYYFP